MWKLWLLVTLMAIAGMSIPAGCSDDDSSSDGDTDSDSDTDSDGDSDGDFGYCAQSCSGAADCVAANANETHDQNNYSCDDGHCVFLGCQSTSECQAVYPAATNIQCDQDQDPPTCATPCTSAADCAVPDSALYGEDNWACLNDLCVWTGCSSTSECQEVYPDTELVCAEYMDIPICGPSCSSPGDCVDEALPADLWAEDHWECTGGACEHKGCLSTEECQASAYGADSICVI